MRFSTNIVLTLATAGSIVAAQPHRHHHRHAGKRSPAETEVVSVPGPTVVAYELNGQTISPAEVCEGIANGSLQWASGEKAALDCSSSAIVPSTSAAAPTPTPALSATSATGLGAQLYQDKVTTASSAIPSPAASSQAVSSAPAASSSSSSSSTTSGGQGLDAEFPDGEIDCSEFPSAYGAIEIPWLNIGGWSGIQDVTVTGNEVTAITTVVSGGSCTEGAMCSYACPPGYQKSQWPSTQGSTGQSVGGLSCSGGKLQLTNPSLSKNLCIQGVGGVNVSNTLSTNAAICRTDYPGTEDETVPLNTEAGSIYPLTVPDESTYYVWQGSSTSAQYYINNQGVSEADACTWSSDGSGVGNWAPTYLGVGMDTSGKTWLSIASTAQNDPSSYTPLDYTVEITGDNLSDTCRLQNGQYCSGSDYSSCNTQGCTVELMSGTATYVLSD